MPEAAPAYPPYPNATIGAERAGDFPVVTAEIPKLGESGRYRSHLRIIGAPGTPVAGHPLIYSDTYSRNDRTIGYARHSVDQETFLGRLEEFLAGIIATELGELRNQSTRCVMQTREKMDTLDNVTYQAAIDAMKAKPSQLIFARLNFPFGDMTVDFRDDAEVIKDELSFTSEKTLQRRIESPLFVFDATESTGEPVWTPFLASIHWARDRVKPEILRQVLRLGTRVLQL